MLIAILAIATPCIANHLVWIGCWLTTGFTFHYINSLVQASIAIASLALSDCCHM